MSNIDGTEAPTTQEIDAIGRLNRDPDGKIFFEFLSRRLGVFDAQTRNKLFGDPLIHKNGRRAELNDILSIANTAKPTQGVNREKQAAIVTPPPPLD